MAIFNYKGLDKTGKETKGTINSDSLLSAKQKVKGMGIMLISIDEQTSNTATKNSVQISFGQSISIGELALMTRQLATLIRAKIQIVEAFSALVDQTENPKLRVILSEIRQKVNEGSSLAKAMSDYPTTFDNVFINMVEAGEQSGNLEIVLLRLADFTEAQVKLRTKIKSAMMYPIIMMSIGTLMIGVIFIVVIPKITRIFASVKKELPLQTKICIAISDFLQGYWWSIPIFIFAARYIFLRWIATKEGRSKFDSLTLRAPILGNLVTMINVSRFCSTLSTLLNSGVPILEAMKIVKNLISNVHMQAAVEEARVSVSEGNSMVSPLVKSGHFPTMVTHMMKLGEKSGELEPMLNIISENYEDQVNNKLAGLTSILEPIMMLGLGLAVAFIVFSIVIPIMDLNSVR